jgi:hypothetical protein
VIERLSAGGKITSSLELKVLSYMSFTGRWRFCVRPSTNWRSRPGRFTAPKALVEEALFERRPDLFTEVELVFFDTTCSILKAKAVRSANAVIIRVTLPDL